MKSLKRHTANSQSVLNAEHKFSPDHRHGKDSSRTPESALNSAPRTISQLSEHAQRLLRRPNLDISSIKPFFWSMVETYLDRFQQYPFDVNRALFSSLEMRDCPEEEVKQLIADLQKQFEAHHGKPLYKPAEPGSAGAAPVSSLDEEIRELRDTLKYAALVAEPGAVSASDLVPESETGPERRPESQYEAVLEEID